jgi:hypothetical protein
MATYTDSFTYSDGALAGNGAWATPTGATGWTVASGAVKGGSAGDFSVSYYNNTTTSEHYSKAVLGGSNDGGANGVAVRVQSGSNSCYYAMYDAASQSIYVGILSSGSGTDYGSAVTGFALGDLLELSVVGSGTSTVLTLKKNGTTQATYDHATYGTIDDLTGGFTGLCGYAACNVTLDTWEGGDVSAGATFIPRATLLGAG